MITINKFKLRVFKIGIMICFFYMAISSISDYINGGDKKKMAQLEKMIQEQTTVIAYIKREYTETSVAKVVKLYHFDYTYDLNGQSYAGKTTLRKIPETNELQLYYLSDDPNITSVDPHKELKGQQNKKHSTSSLVIGLVLGGIATLLLISVVYGLRKRYFKPLIE